MRAKNQSSLTSQARLSPLFWGIAGAPSHTSFSTNHQKADENYGLSIATKLHLKF